MRGMAGLLTIGIFYASVAQAQDHFFQHRKINSSTDARVAELLTKKSNRVYRVLDFNPASAGVNLSSENIVSIPYDKTYDELSMEEREKMFVEFSRHVLTSRRDPPVIHIDHHYPNPIFGFVSTTVLVVDWIRWIHSERFQLHFTGLEKDLLIDLLEHSYPVLDHSDADILNAHYAMSHAGNADLITNGGPILKAAAIFNDYQKSYSQNVDLQRISKILFYTNLGLDHAMKNGEVGYVEAQKLIHEMISFLSSKEMKSLPHSESDFYSILKHSKLTEKFPSLVYSQQGYDRSRLKQMAFEAMLAKDAITKITTPSDLAPGRVHLISGLVIFFAEDQEVAMDSSVAVEVLQEKWAEKFPQLNAAIVISKNISTGAWFIKVRALNKNVNLGQIYPQLRALGLDADGREQAGESAYGKSGKADRSTSELQQDVFKVIETFKKYFCSIDVAKISK
jgi:hypothetical protein